ncbi:hypothetical protein GGS23DRAFT_26766 [Durotheca rogersii]|uniref:uncharacterized protein n=1 Tax=Durotheca rogersii TaxID=419775 RepID=UPI0022201519|nr:uncharacterized protein GGS23DRAFT_26766 [Durotheca rogersii]KAI5868374.1 hypothetical protein GGS23DRAFT_26766 [Durotheca rogersii]
MKNGLWILAAVVLSSMVENLVLFFWSASRPPARPSAPSPAPFSYPRYLVIITCHSAFPPLLSSSARPSLLPPSYRPVFLHPEPRPLSPFFANCYAGANPPTDVELSGWHRRLTIPSYVRHGRITTPTLQDNRRLPCSADITHPPRKDIRTHVRARNARTHARTHARIQAHITHHTYIPTYAHAQQPWKWQFGARLRPDVIRHTCAHLRTPAHHGDRATILAGGEPILAAGQNRPAVAVAGVLRRRAGARGVDDGGGERRDGDPGRDDRGGDGGVDAGRARHLLRAAAAAAAARR